MFLADGGDAERARTGDLLERMPLVAAVRFADDGPALLEALQRGGDRRPPLVVLDLGGDAESDAAGTLAELKADARLRRIPVVLVTGTDRAVVRRGYELGASSCVARAASGEARRAQLAGIAEYWSGIVTLPGPALG